MAITLDTIVNKVFKVVKNGYDNNEVESFLDEILEEMENREAETNKLKEQVAQLTAELNQTKAELHKAQSAATAQPLAAPRAISRIRCFHPHSLRFHSSICLEICLSCSSVGSSGTILSHPFPILPEIGWHKMNQLSRKEKAGSFLPALLLITAASSSAPWKPSAHR